MVDAILHFLQGYSPTRLDGAVWVVVLTTIVVMMVWERRQPSHGVDHRARWRRDLSAAVVCSYLIVPAASYINRFVGYTPILPMAVFKLPFAVRFLLWAIVGDFGYYWLHRAMHTKWLWNVHRWHHSPGDMYWLVGYRSSLTQTVLVNLPYIFAQGILAVSPWWTYTAIGIKTTIQSNWMHMNTSWGPRWLEWFIVTPRYHHVHHSNDPQYYNANVSALFPIWDHLFGTYHDPAPVQGKIHFGTQETASRLRLALGL
jgi:sterol desaturase/sphingolipid hydroxylase (fatty acid hydroxylase superfamily)